jgi:serine/threonine protein kinase
MSSTTAFSPRCEARSLQALYHIHRQITDSVWLAHRLDDADKVIRVVKVRPFFSAPHTLLGHPYSSLLTPDAAVREARVLLAVGAPHLALVRMLDCFCVPDDSMRAGVAVTELELLKTIEELPVTQYYPAPFGRLVSYARPLIDTLAVLHDAGYLLRDIEPDNLLYDPKTMRLVFCGLSRATGPADHGLCVDGTGAAFRPLTVRSDAPCTKQTDIYALGMTLRFLVSKFELQASDNPATLDTTFLICLAGMTNQWGSRQPTLASVQAALDANDELRLVEQT